MDLDNLPLCHHKVLVVVFHRNGSLGLFIPLMSEHKSTLRIVDWGFRSGALAWIYRGLYTLYAWLCPCFMRLTNLHTQKPCRLNLELPYMVALPLQWSSAFAACDTLFFCQCVEFPDLLHGFEKWNLSLSSAAGHTERLCLTEGSVN